MRNRDEGVDRVGGERVRQHYEIQWNDNMWTLAAALRGPKIQSWSSCLTVERNTEQKVPNPVGLAPSTGGKEAKFLPEATWGSGFFSTLPGLWDPWKGMHFPHIFGPYYLLDYQEVKGKTILLISTEETHWTSKRIIQYKGEAELAHKLRPSDNPEATFYLHQAPTTGRI